MSDVYSEEFISALRKNDLKKIAAVPKSDLHNHVLYGGNRDFIAEKTGIYIPALSHKIDSIGQIDSYVNYFTKSLDIPVEKYFLTLMAATLFQAKYDGISVLLMDVDAWMLYTYFESDLHNLAMLLHETADESNSVKLLFQIGISRYSSESDVSKWFKRLWDSDLISSIDLYGPEEYDNTDEVADIYRIAGERGWKLCAHLGEWTDAELLLGICKKLHLDHINHGIRAIESKETTEYLAEHNITLHICPTSNVLLQRCNGYADHPIAELYRNNVNVTINTDDFLVFGSSLSQEYLNLYNNRVLTAEELDSIRVYGLNLYRNGEI